MNYLDIIGEFINRLQTILAQNAPELNPNTVSDIKADANEALNDILVKYNLIKPNDNAEKDVVIYAKKPEDLI